MSDRVQLWSCGGGRQSAGIAALIALGRLPPPEAACMVRLEWEVARVWPYVEAHIIPALAAKGVPFHAIDRKQYATRDFWGGADGKSILLPVYSDASGELSKLPEYCSGEWKREVVARWAAKQPGWKARGVDMWVGITWEERHRRRGPRLQWLQPAYPLLDMLPRPLHVSACLAAVEEIGWPEPPRSRCAHCPNQSDAEWAELTPEEWETACVLDESIRETDPHAYLHRSLTPLRLVTLHPAEDRGGAVYRRLFRRDVLLRRTDANPPPLSRPPRRPHPRHPRPPLRRAVRLPAAPLAPVSALGTVRNPGTRRGRRSEGQHAPPPHEGTTGTTRDGRGQDCVGEGKGPLENLNAIGMMMTEETLELWLQMMNKTHRLYLPPDFPTIVCLCGSTRFYEAFQRANYEETMGRRSIATAKTTRIGLGTSRVRNPWRQTL